MATYGYRCDGCGYAFDRQHAMGKAPDALPCPNCDGQAQRRVTFPAGVHWRNARGQRVRAPSAQWVSMEEYEAASAKVPPAERDRRAKRGTSD